MTEKLVCYFCAKEIGAIVGGDLNCSTIFCVECAEKARQALALMGVDLKRMAYGDVGGGRAPDKP